MIYFKIVTDLKISSGYYAPKSVLGSGDIAMNKTEKIPAFMESTFQWER